MWVVMDRSKLVDASQASGLASKDNNTCAITKPFHFSKAVENSRWQADTFWW